MEIRSYRNVFDLERRIYRIDRLRLNPTGVPLRGVTYFLATCGLVLLAGRLPTVGVVVRLAPWYLRAVLLPGATATLLTAIKVEGRSFHLTALALLRYGWGPRELAGLRPRVADDRRWRPRELVVLADGSDARLRRLRYTGPGAALVSVAHVRLGWRGGSIPGLRRSPAVTLAPLPGDLRPSRGRVIVLPAGTLLEVRR
jgi:hypothetical protein